jgi:amidohydrolase
MDGFTRRCAVRTIPIAALLFLECGQSSIADGIEDDVQPFLPVVVQAYDYLHRNPELGKQEFKAHKYLEGQLRQLGYTQFVASKSVPTAVIAVLDTGRPGPVIALRAEMDARPLPPGENEPATHSPHSELAGLMHNCGHDAHAAILLGTAASLLHNANKLRGKVVFLFQPAEETPGGADDIVNERLLDTLGVTKIYAEHSAPGIPVGTITISSGPTMAGSNYFTLELNGRSAHAAAPHESDDVLLSAAKIAEEISYAPARRFEIAARPIVISITKFVADGGASNVLPAKATINGTIRAFENPKVAPAAGKSIEETLVGLVDGLSKSYGLTYRWDLRNGSPPTVNNPILFDETVRPLAAAFPGVVDTSPYKGMYSEDFAYYTPNYEALYFSLGIAKDGLGQAGVHTEDFTIDQSAFKYGLILMNLLAEIGTTGRADWSSQ